MMRPGIFRLALRADDQELRNVIRRTEMPGTDISIAFCREPSFFIAEDMASSKCETLIYEDKNENSIFGVGSRSIRTLYVDGFRKNVGYLSSLRLLPEVRNGRVLLKGYKALRKLHSDGEVPYYITTVLDENVQAKELFEAHHPSLPIYQPFRKLVTHMIPLTHKGRGPVPCTILSGSEYLKDAYHCLSRWNSRHQFAQVYSIEDLQGKGRLPFFSGERMYVAREKGKVVGTLAIWNQEKFKQTVITAYSRKMKAVRFFYNLVAKFKHLPRLPKAGGTIHTLAASHVSSTGNNPDVLRSLLEVARDDWSKRGYDYLTIGFDMEHPLELVARSLAHKAIRSTLYVVYWPDEKVVLPSSDLLSHPEIATL